ncbi:MAG: hypothetical protein JRJ26_09910 [Deltaproteobacteria bacterium]|nr:hypothetical protein [Deltaproteobacteria bacterium]
MDFCTLVWTPEDVRVITDLSVFTAKIAIPPKDRYWLGLYRDKAGVIYLRAKGNRQPFWISRDGGLDFEPLAPVPGNGEAIPGYRCKVHSTAGVLTAVEGRHLWVYGEGGRWTRRKLPQEFHFRDVSIDPGGGAWFAGSVDSRRIPGEETEAAVRYQAEPGAPFEPRSPRLNPLDGARLIREGGLAELRTIDAEGPPVIAASVCSWLLDDGSSFVFVFGPDRTHTRRLKGEMIRSIDRSDQPGFRLFTCQGTVWQARGTRWEGRSMVGPILKALCVSGRTILVRAVDTCRKRIVAAVEASPPGAGGWAQDPEFTAVCVSLDGGKTFEMVHRFDFREGVEIQDVTWLCH